MATAASVPQGRRTSVRTVLLAWVLGLTTLAVLVSTGLTAVLQLAGVRERVDAALRQEVEEFRRFAQEGVDPESGGAPFADVERLLLVALQRNVPDANETFLVLVDGRVPFLPRTERSLQLEDDEAFVDLVRATPPDGQVLLRDAEVAGRTVRFAAVPVRVEGSDRTGVYVVAYDLDAERADVLGLLRTFAVVDVVALALVALAAGVVVGRLLRPVRLLRETAQRINDTGLDERIEVTGRDELADLAVTFNAMLDRLESAFAGQREFMDDAGHELRTPITILRGHLELLDPADPADVRETRALLLDELDRMSRLVEDLVLLAKARRPDFVVPAPVELPRLVRGVLDKARALGDRRWQLDTAPEGVALFDAQRVEQALLQLASNAVRFTPPGGTVALGAALSGQPGAGTVRLWVRDDGEGLAPHDHARVFERFGRASTGRGEAGSGLGLAIVQAIAAASGGRVSVHSRRGAGARFTLELPWVAPDAPGPTPVPALTAARAGRA